MRIIDEKGRLLSKINIIDFLVIVFLISLVPISYFGYKAITKKPVAEDKRIFSELEINCNFIKVEPKIIKLIRVGDREIVDSGELIGEIIWLGDTNPYRYMVDIGASKVRIINDLVLKMIPTKLKLKIEIKGDGIYYKGKKIAIDAPFEFRTNKYTIMAILEKEKREKSNVDLYIDLKDLDEDTFKLVAVGDKELDDEGNALAEIINIGKTSSDVYEVNLGEGNFVILEDNNKKMLTVKMRCKGEIGEDRRLYFRGEVINNNSLFEFKTEKYIAMGTISKSYGATPLMQVKVKFEAVMPELAKLISEGDTEKDYAKDIIIARLKSIISKKPSTVLAFKDDKFIILTHPFQKDIVADLELLGMERNGVIYFKSIPVKTGNAITFTTNLYSVTGTIIAIENN